MRQLLHEVDGQVLHPDQLDHQEREGGDAGVLLWLSLHNSPQVFDRIQIRRIARPIHDVDVVLLEEGHHLLTFVAGRPVLQELGGAQPGHPREELLSQHLEISLAVHGHFRRKKVERASSSNTTEAAPDRDARGMLDVHSHVLLLVPVDACGTANSLRPGIDKLESRFVGKHNRFPVLLGPVEVFLQNLSLFFTMAEVRRGFLAAARDRIFNRFWQPCWISLTEAFFQPCTSLFISLAVLNGLRSMYRRSLSSSLLVVIRGRLGCPPKLVSYRNNRNWNRN